MAHMRWLSRPAIFFVLAILAATLSGCATKPPPQTIGKLGTIELTPAHQGTYHEGTSLPWLKFLLRSKLNDYAKEGVPPPGHILEHRTVETGLARLLKAPSGALWIGHSTFLLRVGGLTVLTDPVFADIAAPWFSLGPRRYIPPALTVQDLPPLDAIIISHDHYDHLDEHALARIARRFPRTVVLLPKGDEEIALEAGFRAIRPLEPGRSRRIGNVTFTAFPAYHKTSRHGFDCTAKQALSWSIRPQHGVSVYFAGDTGYGGLFRRIRRAYGRHDIALVPVGAYEPRRELRHIHANPEEAVKIADDIGARVAVPIHWGTFPISDEPFMEPLRRFSSAPGKAERRSLKIGESTIF